MSKLNVGSEARVESRRSETADSGRPSPPVRVIYSMGKSAFEGVQRAPIAPPPEVKGGPVKELVGKTGVAHLQNHDYLFAYSVGSHAQRVKEGQGAPLRSEIRIRREGDAFFADVTFKGEQGGHPIIEEALQHPWEHGQGYGEGARPQAAQVRIPLKENPTGASGHLKVGNLTVVVSVGRDSASMNASFDTRKPHNLWDLETQVFEHASSASGSVRFR